MAIGFYKGKLWKNLNLPLVRKLISLPKLLYLEFLILDHSLILECYSLPVKKQRKWEVIFWCLPEFGVTLFGGSPCKAYNAYQNVLQMVVWESIFFNQAVSSVKITRLWAVLINRWISTSCNFSVFWKPLISWFSAAVTVQSRCRYSAIALPLHWNGVAITP